MSIFSKKKDENLLVDTEDIGIAVKGESSLAPDAITADEITSAVTLNYDNTASPETSPLDALKKRMSSSIVNSGTVNQKNTEVTISQESFENETEPKHVKEEEKEEQEEQVVKTEEKSLLEKLKRYTIDEHGRDVSENTAPLYELESVAEIIKSNGEKTLESLSKKYDISFDDLGKNRNVPKEEKKGPDKNDQINDGTIIFEKVSPHASPAPTPAFEKMVSDSEKYETKQIFEKLFPEKKGSVTTNLSEKKTFDTDSKITTFSTENKNISDTATVRFTPIKDSKGNTDHIVVSNITKHIDLSGDTATDIKSTESIDTNSLQQTEFELFNPKNEFVDITDKNKLIRHLAINKRSCFLQTIISTLMTLATLVYTIPSVHDFILSNPRTSMIICGIFLLVSIIANISMFKGLALLFNKKASADTMMSLASISTLTLTVVAAITLSDAYFTILLNCVILSIRSFFSFKYTSAKLNNLKQIANSSPKKAVSLISDSATTFVMAKNSIEGDILIAAPKNTNFIENFMKHYDFDTNFSLKLPKIFYITLTFTLASGLAAYFYYDSIFNAFYCATTIAAISATPILFLIDSLPLACAAKKLNPKGAMIAGITAAEKLELANAAVISPADIFPEGTVTLHSMKVLSQNNIDETLMRAASLTEAMKSPLAHIFKEIAGTSASYVLPDSDTVKYEKRQGISGWVDNELLLIGNRTLMEARGIEIPSVELDKQILRNGYFPVYVSTDTKACALLMVQYNVKKDISRELRRIADLGVTLLVNNCDPNINENMICDYFGLYEDSVKVMSNVGVHMYKNATLPTERTSAPASYKGSNMKFISIMNCASRIKKSNTILIVAYILAIVLSAVFFIYATFSGAGSMPSPATMLEIPVIATVLSGLIFLIKKP